MNASPSTETWPDIESRLTRAHEIAAAAVHTLRLALAGAPAREVVALVDRVDDFFSLLDAIDASARMARSAMEPDEARELAEDAYHLAIAARREARARARQLRDDPSTRPSCERVLRFRHPALRASSTGS